MQFKLTKNKKMCHRCSTDLGKLQPGTTGLPPVSIWLVKGKRENNFSNSQMDLFIIIDYKLFQYLFHYFNLKQTNRYRHLFQISRLDGSAFHFYEQTVVRLC